MQPTLGTTRSDFYRHTLKYVPGTKQYGAIIVLSWSKKHLLVPDWVLAVLGLPV